MQRWGLGLAAILWWHAAAGVGSPVVTPPSDAAADSTGSVWRAETLPAPGGSGMASPEGGGATLIATPGLFVPGPREQAAHLVAAAGLTAAELAPDLETNTPLAAQVRADKALIEQPRHEPKPPPPVKPRVEGWNPFQNMSGADWFNLIFAVVIVLVVLVKGR